MDVAKGMGAGRGVCLQNKSQAVQVMSLGLPCVTLHLRSCNSGVLQGLSSYSAPYFALKSVGSGFFGDLAAIRGVLVQSAVEIHSPHEELALWESWEPGLTPLLQLKGRNQHLVALPPMKIPRVPWYCRALPSPKSWASPCRRAG